MPKELFNSLQSVKRRFLVENQIQEQETLLIVLTTFRQYVISDSESF
ncbi:MAG: hypothetical protein WBA93_28900 [Microcoleaceae cyanobacterium]